MNNLAAKSLLPCLSWNTTTGTIEPCILEKPPIITNLLGESAIEETTVRTDGHALERRRIFYYSNGMEYIHYDENFFTTF